MRELVKLVAAETGADERTVMRWLAGIEVRGATGVAIDRAFTARGIAQPNAPLAIVGSQLDALRGGR